MRFLHWLCLPLVLCACTGEISWDRDTEEPTPTATVTPEDWIGGCTDEAASNFDPAATRDDGSCTYDCETAPVDHWETAVQDTDTWSYRVPAPARDPEPAPYLRATHDLGLDLQLEVALQSAAMCEQGLAPVVLSRTGFADTYWTPAQQLAHLTANGATTVPGDLFASGTVSGPEPGSEGSLIELTADGAPGEKGQDQGEPPHSPSILRNQRVRITRAPRMNTTIGIFHGDEAVAPPLGFSGSGSLCGSSALSTRTSPL